MRILVESDSTSAVDIPKTISVLDVLCKTIQFKALSARQVDKKSPTLIELQQELSRIEKRFDREEYDYYVYVTAREYEDNFYFYSQSEVAVLSLANWEHYTSLPVENGFLFFLARFVAGELHNPVQHDDLTGCLFDFLGLKLGIDQCLKMGLICENCREDISKHIQSDPSASAAFDDVISVLDAVANTSRWGQSAFRVLEDTSIKDLNWSSFEDAIADHYRSLGGEVKQNINIAGFQIDLLLSERTPSGEMVRSVVECKFHKEKVGNRVTNDFARIVATIVAANKAERGIIVSYSGFTQDAHLAAEHAKVRLVHYKDIVAKPRSNARTQEGGDGSPGKPLSATPGPRKTQLSNEVFVIMPFSSDLDDLFYFGIYETINRCGATCVRLDQMEFTGGILEKTYEHLQSARLVIAEVTQHNPNVYYELGYAHARSKPTILLTSDLHKAPFDISGFNHIVYTSIKDLRAKLSDRLNVLLQ